MAKGEAFHHTGQGLEDILREWHEIISTMAVSLDRMRLDTLMKVYQLDEKYFRLFEHIRSNDWKELSLIKILQLIAQAKSSYTAQKYVKNR